MIVVTLATATGEQLERLAACSEWYIGPRMYIDIRKGSVDLGPVEETESAHRRVHGIRVTVDSLVGPGVVIGRELDDPDLRLAFGFSARKSVDGMPGGDVGSTP